MGRGALPADLPDFDVVEWAALPYPQRLRMMCEAWAVQGFGAPVAAYGFYALKLGRVRRRAGC